MSLPEAPRPDSTAYLDALRLARDLAAGEPTRSDVVGELLERAPAGEPGDTTPAGLLVDACRDRGLTFNSYTRYPPRLSGTTAAFAIGAVLVVLVVLGLAR